MSAFPKGDFSHVDFPTTSGGGIIHVEEFRQVLDHIIKVYPNQVLFMEFWADFRAIRVFGRDHFDHAAKFYNEMKSTGQGKKLFQQKDHVYDHEESGIKRTVRMYNWYNKEDITNPLAFGLGVWLTGDVLTYLDNRNSKIPT